METADKNERLAFGLAQSVFEFVSAIANVEVDEDGANFGGSKLSEHPFGAIGGPDSDAIALLDTDGQETAGEPFDFAMKLGPGEALVSVASDKSGAAGEGSGSAIQHISDGEM